MFFIDLHAAGCGQISDKYQHYGLATLPDGAAPSAFRSRSPSRSREPVVGMKIRVALVSALMAVSGCTTLGRSGPTVTPVATPPAAGKVGTSIVAAMNGGLVGGSIGSGLSDAEKRKGLEAEYKALEYTASGQKVTWKSDGSSHYGEVVAAQPYRVGSQDCRQYTHTVYTGTSGVTARGTACRNADGSWTPLT